MGPRVGAIPSCPSNANFVPTFARRPGVGLKPYIPVYAAGQRIDPPTSPTTPYEC
jgi:hypothetical protein